MTASPLGKGEKAVAVVLRYGAMISTLLMAIGLALALLRGSIDSLAVSHRIHPLLLLGQSLRLEPAALAELGLLVLLLTPVARIVAAAVSFALERDVKYVLISLGVLAVVLASVSLAIET